MEQVQLWLHLFFNQLAEVETQNTLILHGSTRDHQLFTGGLSIGKTLEWFRSVSKVVKLYTPICALMKHENIHREAEGPLTLDEATKCWGSFIEAGEPHLWIKERMFLEESRCFCQLGLPSWNFNFDSLCGFSTLTWAIIQMLLNKMAKLSLNDSLGASDRTRKPAQTLQSTSVLHQEFTNIHIRASRKCTSRNLP